MRLIVVALLGIEISIIALASAASAATFPEGQPAQSGPYEAVPPHPAALGFLETFEVGPWVAHERLMMARGHLLDLRNGWPLTMTEGSNEIHDQPSLLQPRAERPVRVQPRAEQEALLQLPAEQEAPQPRAEQETLLQPPAEQETLIRPRAEQPALIHRRAGRPSRIQPRTAQDRPIHARAGRPSRVQPRAVQEETARERPQTPLQTVRKRPVRTGVAVMPEARPHVAHKRVRPDLSRVMPRQAAMHMSHRTASSWLKSAGLRTHSTGSCTSKHMHHCTSLDSVRAGTIARVIELKRESGCPIMVTGGTEEGHAAGHFSHGNGYKLDISHSACIDRHITKNHHKSGVRSDGAALYRSDTGTTFADESSHWDILFR
ncbi:hypothetical protein [Nonomuraea sp. NPDC002799]